MTEQPPDQVDRYAAVRQYSLAQILGVWAAAAVPMGVLAWVVAPWLRDQLGGHERLAQALLILLTLGLIWQFVLVLILIRHELGGLQWSRVRDALWLRPPRDPKTGRVGGRVWWWLLPFILIYVLEQLLPAIHGPSMRDFGDFASSHAGKEFFRGAWGWFALLVPRTYWDPDTDEAVVTLELAIPLLEQAAGGHVDGVIGDSDPFVAVREAVTNIGIDEILISTRRPGSHIGCAGTCHIAWSNSGCR